MAEPGTGVNRKTVDLSTFPDLVVIYLGMRVRTSVGWASCSGLAGDSIRGGAEP